MWIKITQHTAENQDFNDAMCRAISDFQFDSLALTSCGNLLFTLIVRCLSWTPVLIARCFIIEVGMPVVPIEILVELLTMQVPSFLPPRYVYPNNGPNHPATQRLNLASIPGTPAPGRLAPARLVRANLRLGQRLPRPVPLLPEPDPRRLFRVHLQQRARRRGDGRAGRAPRPAPHQRLDRPE